jgi:hypothetical protein
MVSLIVYFSPHSYIRIHEKLTLLMYDSLSYLLCFSRVALLFGCLGILVYVVLHSRTIRFIPAARIDQIEM